MPAPQKEPRAYPPVISMGVSPELVRASPLCRGRKRRAIPVFRGTRVHPWPESHPHTCLPTRETQPLGLLGTAGGSPCYSSGCFETDLSSLVSVSPVSFTANLARTYSVRGDLRASVGPCPSLHVAQEGHGFPRARRTVPPRTSLTELRADSDGLGRVPPPGPAWLSGCYLWAE